MLIDFAGVELCLHPWDKSHLIMVYDPFNVLLNSVFLYFIEDVYTYVIQDIGLQCVCVCVCVLSLIAL